MNKEDVVFKILIVNIFMQNIALGLEVSVRLHLTMVLFQKAMTAAHRYDGSIER